MIPATDHAHMARVRERVSKMDAIASAKATGKNLPIGAIMRLGRQAKQSPGISKRIFWLRKMTAVAEKVASVDAACRRGCSHCCYIDVAVSRPEAAQIARETGMHLQEPFNALALNELAAVQDQGHAPRHTGTPCPFLSNGECSIYDSRPLVCRVHFNMDNDDLLCQLVEGEAIPVPYFNATVLRAITFDVLGLNALYADIREWFAQN